MPDLSVFPILRIDQLRLHDTLTLIRAEQLLSLSCMDQEDRDAESKYVKRYCTKLIDAILTEIALRRIGGLISTSSHDNTMTSDQVTYSAARNDSESAITGSGNKRRHLDFIALNLTNEISSSSTLIEAPAPVPRAKKGFRFRAQAIFRRMKLRYVKESLNTTNDEKRKDAVKHFRKPLMTGSTASYENIKKICKHPFTRTESLQQIKIDSDRVSPCDVTRSLENESPSRSDEVSQRFKAENETYDSSTRVTNKEKRENHESSSESACVCHTYDNIASTSHVNRTVEGMLHIWVCPGQVDHSDENLNPLIECKLAANTESSSDIQTSDMYETHKKTDSSEEKFEHACITGTVDVIKSIKCLDTTEEECSRHGSRMENSIYETTENCIDETYIHEESSMISGSEDIKITIEQRCQDLASEKQNAINSTTGYNLVPVSDRDLISDDENTAELDSHVVGNFHDDNPTTDTSFILRLNKPTSKRNRPPPPQLSCTAMFSTLFPTFDSIFIFLPEHQGKNHSNVNSRNKMDTRKICETLAFYVSSAQSNHGDSAHENDRTIRWYQVQSQREELKSLILDVLDDVDTVGPWRRMESVPTTAVYVPRWNVLWTWGVPKFKFHHLLVCQKVNRFQGTKCLTRKDLLKKKLSQSNGSDIMPATFNLPSEYTLFVSAYQSIVKFEMKEREDSTMQNKNNIWILKPAGMSRGRGIYLIHDIGSVCYSKPFVAQKYISNPLLYHGYKFDLRLYVLVTSFHPLEAFLYGEGLVRFSLIPFSCNYDSLGDPRIHLTNSSIQKNYLNDMSRSHPVLLAGKQDGGGNKVRWSWLRNKLMNENVDPSLIWNRIRECCLKVLLSVDSDIPFQPNSFEIFGFDILLDNELKPWVIEVNGSPSMSRDYPLDSDIKETLIKDTIALVDPSPLDRSALSEICKERLRQVSGRGIDRGEYYCISKLELDLRRIFPNGPPRSYGENPKVMGGFQRLYPKS